MSDKPIIYDFMSQSLQQAVIERKLEKEINNYKTLPATVVGVQDYEDLQCLDVKVAIDDEYVKRDNLVQESIVLKKIFVSLPNAGGFKIKSPVSEGDPCRLQWSNKELGQYLDGTGANVTLKITELADYEDCWVQLDGGTRKNNTKPSVENWVLEGPETSITITPEGKVSIITTAESYSKSAKHTYDNDVQINGKLNVTDTVTSDVSVGAPTLSAADSLTVSGTEMKSHTHGGVSRGNQNTDPV